MRALACLVAALSAQGCVRATAQGAAVQRIGTVAHEPLTEISGIVKSATYPDVWWVHNDSGHAARLFAVDAEGQVIVPEGLQRRFRGEKARRGREPWPGLSIEDASNADWEDIALADGRLYIGDIGNNANARRDLGIYVVNEPNPRAVPSARALRFLPVRYPEQRAFPGEVWHFDSEALFVSDGRPYLITRFRQPGRPDAFESGARLYRLDTEHTDRENILVQVDAHDELRLASAADLSPDGRLLAVLTYTALWVFEKPESGDRWLSGRARRLRLSLRQTKQAESVCWDDAETLRVVNEQREIFRIALSSLERVP